MKKLLLISVFTLSVGINCLHALDTFAIAEGVTVETTGGTYIELAGNLIETGSGYLKGKVSSGAVPRSMTNFAGLTLTVAMTGTIMRTTGTAYLGAPSGGTNMLRYYELNNTGGPITPNVTASYKVSAPHNEQNNLSGPYFIYNSDDPAWAAYGDGVTATPITANTVVLAAGASDLVFSEGIKINSKFFLEGPYDDVSGTMLTTINSSIPLSSPYSEDPRTVPADPGVPSTAVDWVLVEVRATTDGTPLGYRSCFLKTDGRLIADDGSNDIGLAWIPGDYYVVLRHRNHLAIMSAASVSGLTWGLPTAYDFSTAQAQAYGANPMILIDLSPVVFGCYAGDASNNGQVQNDDKNDYWKAQVGTSGYKSADFNLNDQVQNDDKNGFWRSNVGRGSQVPNPSI